MTIIANLDAEIEQFYAEQGAVKRELQIFGRVWPLIPAMTSTTLAPLMQIQAAAQMSNGGVDANDPETRAMLFQFLGGVNDILSNVIHVDVRDEFRAVIEDRGFPLGILDKVIEAIMQAFDAAPFDSGTPTANVPTTQPLAPVSNIGSGPSLAAVGDISTATSTPTPAATIPAAQPVQSSPVGPTVAEWGTERVQPYDESTALIPPSVQDVPPA